jgi:hypothetical protein
MKYNDKNQSVNSKDQTSRLQSFDVFFEYDKTIQEVKRDIKRRII